ncbi:GDSL-type esterase/lipase family protein [Lentilactobacillus senioris]|uniref:GDSL-type esterase/lipase family protein n=1 Tax=Lentilactobacillus senioris TaxID=931534 RepID=UPI002282513E|nr:GDSL-type esterase/lipase family protein [Lentilactobacillus senioris]MCY9806826.1 GDSL-type esterase/lipase family protein [Lentilactobacillus senioris]
MGVKKIKRRGLIGAGLVIVVGLVLAGAHFFKTTQTPHIQITAVGDSLTQGIGDNNQGGYPTLISKKLTKQKKAIVKSSNYGIAGETTTQINDRVTQNTKVQKGLKKANVITITTGGNDLLAFFKNNALETNTNKLAQKADAAAKDYQTHLQELLTNVRKLNPKANIYLFGIYNPLYVYFPQVNSLTQTVAKWNRTAQNTVSQNKRVYFIAIDDQLSNGQYKTVSQRAKLKMDSSKVNASSTLDASSISTIFSGSGKEINNYLSNDDHFHPNHKGYQIMTNDLYKAMTSHENWLKEK